jgi:hypothetical protein
MLREEVYYRLGTMLAFWHSMGVLDLGGSHHRDDEIGIWAVYDRVWDVMVWTE